MKFISFFSLLAFLTVPLAGLQAKSAEEFYEGRTIRWVVPYRPGGGYDQYSRLLAPYIEKYSGASVEIINLPGGGGMKGAMEIYRSPADGLHIGVVNGSATAGNEIASEESVSYEMSKFSYIARIAAEDRVLVVGTKTGIESIEGALEPEVIIGSTGRGGSSYVDTVITTQVLGAPWKLVSGFDSSSDLRLAILRGDIHAMWGSYGSAVEGIETGELKPILRAGVLPIAALDDIPSVADVTDGDTELVEAWRGLAEIGRPVVGPPGIPYDRLDFLRHVLESAITDPEFEEKARAAGRELSFQNGAEIEATVAKASKMSSETRKTLADAILEQP